MRSLTVATAALLLISTGEPPALAQTLDPVQQLLSTRACSGCNLSNADLSGQDLSAVDLQGATLNNANLSGANLSGANLSGARLYLTNLNNANAAGANLSDTDLTSAKLETADLTGANLTKANLSYANLTQATLINSNFAGANLNDANLQNVIGTNANFTGSSANYANLSNADLSQANFADATLLSAQMSGANLNQANFERANLTAAKLDQATLTDANLANATLDKTTLADADLPTPPSTDTPPQQPVADSGATGAPAADGIPSPLRLQQFQQPSAYTLPQGVFVGKGTVRFFSLSASEAGTDDTAFYPRFGFSAGITDEIELEFAYQQADSNSPGRQGPFNVSRVFGIENPGNDELTLAVKGKIWENDSETLAIGARGALSFTPTSRRNRFSNAGIFIDQENEALVPEIQIPVSAKLGDRTLVTLSPTVAFFPNNSALFLSTAPGIGGSFGTTFGFTGSIAHNLIPRLSLWGDAFVPVTGNNTINRNSGRPDKEIAFNAGVRYLVNPSLALDVFATNTQGSLGPLALTTQPGSVGVGANLVFLPNVVPNNRRIADNHRGEIPQADSPRTIDGLGFFDGGTVPKNKFAFHIQGGSQGFLTALRYGAVKDFEVGVFLDYISSRVDESEQGISAKVRLLDQAKGAPLTVSLAGTLSQTNNVFTNFVNNNPTELDDRGLNKGFPFIGGRDDGNRLFIVTAALPLHYRFNDRANAWFTPIIGVAQRDGVEAGGFNLGGEFEVIPSISLIAELGVDFIGRGNSFSTTRLVDRLPWNVGVRIDPALFFNSFVDTPRENRPHLEVYVTNRVGSSPWHQLRVRDGNDIAIGAGILFPF